MGSRPETPQGDTQAGLAMGLLEWYDHLMVDLRDPRVDNWLGMASIWPTIIICSAYVYFVKVVGPRLMKDREPYELKNILLVYNFSQVLFSFWMFMEGWGFYISGNYSWHCEPVDYSESPVARRALNLAWWYYFSMLIDLKGDGLSGEGLHEDLHTSPKTENEMEGGLLLDVVVGKGPSVFELLASEDQPLLVRGDALLVPDLGLHVLNGV